MQQTILPFVLEGTDNLLLPPDARPSEPTRKRKCADTRMGAVYSVPLDALSKEELERHKRELTMTPADNGYGSSVPFEVFAVRDATQRFEVPRFYGFRQWGAPEIDETDAGQPMAVPFQGSLNPVQREATSDILGAMQKAPHAAMLVLPCGYGKTVCSLFIAQQLGRRTLVLVHKGFLVQQWHERAQAFLPGATVGKIQQNVVDADADIVVAMVQSVSKREYPERILRNFGTIIIDEAHHMAAPVFSGAMRCLPGRYVLGLSATPERKDGLTHLLHYVMGDIGYRIERKPEHTLVSCMLYEGGKRREITYRDGRVSMPLMLNALVKDPVRNECIALQILKYARAGRNIIVLSDRIVQLNAITEILVARGAREDDIAYYIGGTPASERQRATERRIIMSTYSMAKEGLDIPRLDTLILATPKGDVVQASGRIQRKHPEKRIPLIVDIVDTFSVFEALRWKRWNFYRKEQFNCQTFDITKDDSPWFV